MRLNSTHSHGNYLLEKMINIKSELIATVHTLALKKYSRFLASFKRNGTIVIWCIVFVSVWIYFLLDSRRIYLKLTLYSVLGMISSVLICVIHNYVFTAHVARIRRETIDGVYLYNNRLNSYKFLHSHQIVARRLSPFRIVCYLNESVSRAIYLFFILATTRSARR